MAAHYGDFVQGLVISLLTVPVFYHQQSGDRCARGNSCGFLNGNFVPRGEKMSQYTDQSDEELIIEQMGKTLWKFISVLSGDKKDAGKVKNGNLSLLPDHFVILGGGEFESQTFDLIFQKLMALQYENLEYVDGDHKEDKEEKNQGRILLDLVMNNKITFVHVLDSNQKRNRLPICLFPIYFIIICE